MASPPPLLPGLSLPGRFYLNSGMTAADFPDGLSNTAFLSEVIAVPGEDIRGMITYPEGCFYHHNYTPNSTTPDGIRNGYCVSVTNAPCTSAFTFVGEVSASGIAASYHDSPQPTSWWRAAIVGRWERAFCE